MRRPRVRNAKFAVVGLVLTLLLAACGSDGDDDSDRSFAPEAQGDTALPTNTPAPTETPPPLNRQPGESSTTRAETSALFKSVGGTKSLMSGVAGYAVVDLASGKSHDLGITRSSALLAVAAPDGDRILVIDRSGAVVTVRMLRADGSLIDEWSPNKSGSPVASPVAAGNSIRPGDHISWRQDGSAAAVAISGEGLFVAGKLLEMTPLPALSDVTVTAIAWSSSGVSVVAGVWDQATNSASLWTSTLSSPDAAAITVLALPDQDGRFIRSVAWGSERVGIVFALRSVRSDFSLPNDLYYLPKFGEPMRLLASAGLAAPAAVVDQVAVAGNGTTFAFTVQVPSGSGLRFHSVWVTDALSPAPVQADTTGLRRVVDLQWSENGLVVSGTRREQTDRATYLVAVVEVLSETEPREVAAIRGDATPVASPVASPVAATR